MAGPKPVPDESLSEALTKLRTKTLPTDYWDRMSVLQQEFVASAQKHPVLKQHDRLPENAVATDLDGRAVKLADLHRDGPLILSFFRGGWCSFCNLELQALARTVPELTEQGATLAVVSPMTPEVARVTKETHDLQFLVLSDVGNRLAREFGIVFANPADLFAFNLEEYNGDDSFELPVPATYVIDTAGVIRYAFIEFDWTYRADPIDITKTVRRLTGRSTTAPHAAAR